MAHGGFCRVELSTPDLEKSKTFYERVFGWTFQVFPGMKTCAMFRTPGDLGGGFDTGPDAEPPSGAGSIPHIEVEDIDAAPAKNDGTGGRTLIEKTRIPDELGYYAVFLDNVGNRLGLWSQD